MLSAASVSIVAAAVRRRFEKTNQAIRCLERALDEVLLQQELVSGHQTLIARVNQVIEHLSFRTFRNPHELRELLVLESRETFGDVARARPGSVVQLIAELEAALEIRPRKVSIYLHLQLMRQLPGHGHLAPTPTHRTHLGTYHLSRGFQPLFKHARTGGVDD